MTLSDMLHNLGDCNIERCGPRAQRTLSYSPWVDDMKCVLKVRRLHQRHEARSIPRSVHFDYVRTGDLQGFPAPATCQPLKVLRDVLCSFIRTFPCNSSLKPFAATVYFTS